MCGASSLIANVGRHRDDAARCARRFGLADHLVELAGLDAGGGDMRALGGAAQHDRPPDPGLAAGNGNHLAG
jgi:hypothetical protein